MHRHGQGHHMRKAAHLRYLVNEDQEDNDKPSHSFLDLHHQVADRLSLSVCMQRISVCHKFY